MKGERGLPKTLGLVGCGIGIVVFILFGLLHGALIGGTAGLQAGSYLFGDGIGPRIAAAAGMAAGVAVVGMAMVAGGYAAGKVLGVIFSPGLEMKKHALTGAVRN